MEISIIIPTHNRANLLNISLEKIYSNNFPKNKYEIIVIDDGSQDNTKEICQKWAKQKNLIYIKQKKAGQGVARNRGIDIAKGKIILFCQDDIFVTKNFLQEHYNTHQKTPKTNFACLGLILWDPEININEVMKWSTNEINFLGKFKGHQFDFSSIKNNQILNYNYFYTSNISLKSKIFKNDKFDPWFDGYGWEDIELGYRLEKNQNLKIIYNSSALAYHHHEISFKDLTKRMYQIGMSLHLFEKKHPNIKEKLSNKKKLIFRIISNPLIINTVYLANKIFKNKLIAVYYYCISKKFFLKGYQNIPNKII